MSPKRVLSVQGFIIFSILCTISASDEQGASHYKPCPDGHVTYQHKCFQLREKQRFKDTRCQLAAIGSEEENNIIKGMMKEASATSLWIKGREPNTYYGNYIGSYYGRCTIMNHNGKWNTLYSCGKRRQPVCFLRRECQEEWFGLKCDRQCHCYKENCTRELHPCVNGCQPGWVGRYCQDFPKPKIEHYCLKDRTHYKLMLTLDLSVFYQSMVPLDSEGRPINQDQFKRKYWIGLHTLEISTRNLSTPFTPNYYERKVDEQGTTFEWTFRLREQNNVRLPNDVDFRVRCNFSDPDEMYRSVTFNYGTGRNHGMSKATKLPSDVSISLFLTEPFDIKPLSEVVLGQPVKLAVVQNVVNASGSSPDQVYLVPRKCFASSPDGLVVRQLSDANGCPIVEQIFKMFDVNDDNQAVTSRFTAFGLPGYSTYEITCSLVICHNVRDRTCFKSCSYPMNSRSVRSVMDIKEPVLMDVSTNVVIRD